MRRLALPLALCCVLALGACGAASNALKRTTAIAEAGVKASHLAANRARAAFESWNEAAETAIVRLPVPIPVKLDLLVRLDKARAPVLAAFTILYTALDTLEAAIPLAKEGKYDAAALIAGLLDVAKAAVTLQTAVGALYQSWAL